MTSFVRFERHQRIMTLASAVATFLTQRDLSLSSRRVYSNSLRGLQDGLGADVPLATLDEPRTAEWLGDWFRKRYEHSAPATRVLQLAILRSACVFGRTHACITTDPNAGLEPPVVPLDRTRAVTCERMAALWRRDDVALRERVFWRSMLPRLLAGRSRGPVFLADRRPTRAVPSVDRCPVTGRARLSYRRVAELFSQANPDLTLHQLRHSALTRAGEDGTSTPILLARSRHASVRSLEHHARPGPEAVALYVAEHDPARRRRRRDVAATTYRVVSVPNCVQPTSTEPDAQRPKACDVIHPGSA